MSRRRGRDACSPAAAHRWKLAEMANRPSGFSALMASQDTCGTWIADGRAGLFGITQTAVPPFMLKSKEEIIADLTRTFDEIVKRTGVDEDPLNEGGFEIRLTREGPRVSVPLTFRPIFLGET
jgi:hypothetical protein